MCNTDIAALRNLHALARKQVLTSSRDEQKVLRRPARHGLSHRCGLTRSIAAAAFTFPRSKSSSLLFRKRIKTVTHIVELPSFAEDGTRMRRIHGFLRSQGKKAC